MSFLLFFYRVLDEHEMYTEQKLFQLNDFVMLTYFLNNILYKIINEDIFGKLTKKKFKLCLIRLEII